MQTNDILILVLKDNKLNKTKFLIKLKEALALKTPLIFNGCVPV